MQIKKVTLLATHTQQLVFESNPPPLLQDILLPPLTFTSTCIIYANMILMIGSLTINQFFLNSLNFFRWKVYQNVPYINFT